MAEEKRSFFQSDLFTFMPCLGIGILTVSTVLSSIKARHDLPTLAFILSIYIFLMLLFLCLHLHDRSPPNSKMRERLKIPMWLFSTILNVLFAQRVSMIIPLPLGCLIWAMASCTSLCGFYLFFIHRHCDDKSKTNGNDDAKADTKLTKPSNSEPPFAGEKV